MGLDMYLEKIHRDVDGYRDVDIDELDSTSELYKKLESYFIVRGNEFFHWTSLFEEVGYWRKANAIHNWFVENAQDGEDDCDRYEVSKEQLEELLDICKELLQDIVMVRGKVVNGQTLTERGWENNYEDGMVILNPEECAERLPTVGGFFFGSTDYNCYYLEDITVTISILSKVLDTTDFDQHKIYYRSSW